MARGNESFNVCLVLRQKGVDVGVVKESGTLLLAGEEEVEV